MKLLSKVTDFIFHPLLIPIYAMVLFFRLTPLYFPENYKNSILLASFLIGVSIPVIMYMILFFMGWINAKIVERSHKYTILVYCLILIALYEKVFSTQPATNFSLIVIFMLIGYGFLLFASILRKNLSVKMMAIASLTSFVIGLGFLYQNNYTFIVSVLIAITGWIATTQVYSKKYSIVQLMLGWCCGWIPQLCIFGYLQNYF